MQMKEAVLLCEKHGHTFVASWHCSECKREGIQIPFNQYKTVAVGEYFHPEPSGDMAQDMGNVILRYLRNHETLTANSELQNGIQIRDRLLEIARSYRPTYSVNIIGFAFQALARRGLIKKVDMTTTTKEIGHAGKILVWTLTDLGRSFVEGI